MNDASNIIVNWRVEIPLRDGVQLLANEYLPLSQAGARPSVFTMTPYVADTYHDYGVYFAARGVPFVIVNVRGRGGSTGVFDPMIQEAADGFDVTEWVSSRSYCDGRVAMWGGSYAGYAQWATAKESPPSLKAIAPVAAPFAGVDFPMRNNIHSPYILQWLHFTNGPALQPHTFADKQFWSTRFLEWHKSGRSFRELDQLLGLPNPHFQEWLDHPEPDAFWDDYNPTERDYSRISIPVLTITGIYDADQAGAIAHYRRHIENAPSAIHNLIIGPWDHAGTRQPALAFSGITCGVESLLDLRQLHFDWYAWAMGAGERPAFLQKRVAYYVLGAERWCYADSLDAITAESRPLFLASRENPDDVFSSGALSEQGCSGGPDTYRHTPTEATCLAIECEARADGDSIVDQSAVLALRGKALFYHSAPFERDTELAGFFRLKAWIAIDTPDTDLYVSVYEIALDGSSLLLANDAIRARYRANIRSAQLVQTTEPLLYDFCAFTFVSRLVRKGHRLRLVIAPIGRLVFSTFFEKNYGGGGTVADETAADAKPVQVSLFHDQDHPSVLYLPIGHGQDSARGLGNA